jgi:hypothetical protein
MNLLPFAAASGFPNVSIDVTSALGPIPLAFLVIGVLLGALMIVRAAVAAGLTGRVAERDPRRKDRTRGVLESPSLDSRW